MEESLEECGVILQGHFVLTSGRHSNRYFEKANICKHPALTADICWEIAHEAVSQFKAFGKNRIEVVVGLAPIGVVLANRVAECLEEIYQEKVTAVFTEKDEEKRQVFKRGYEKEVAGKNALIVDDVLTTGGSIGEVKKEVEGLDGRVMAVAVACKRGEIRTETLKEVPVLALLEMRMRDWAPEKCPLCKKGIPITKTK